MSEPKKVTWSEFISHFNEDVRDQVAECRNRKNVDGMVGLVCQVLDSSRCGQLTAMIYGPGWTFKTLEDITSRPGGVYTTGLPSSAAFVEFYTTDKP